MNFYLINPDAEHRGILLIKYFGRKKITQADADEQERYKEHRRSQGAADGTIVAETALLSAVYHMALKRKMISYEAMPGEFLTDVQVNPRPVVSDQDFQRLLDNANADFKRVLNALEFHFKPAPFFPL